MNSEAIKQMAKDKVATYAKIKMMALLSSIGCLPLLLAIFVVIIIIVIIGGDSDASSSSIVNNGECGFTISSTSLTKQEYKQKIEEYAKTHSKATVFAENANSIYDLAVSSNINPELVIIRAAVEGYSPGASKNNYWGLGCYNNAGEIACITYNSFFDGVKGYLNNISKYSSLVEMMESYAYIGDYWVKGSSANGGCYYFNNIKDYYDTSAEAQKSKQRAEKTCTAGGSSSVKTTEYDQAAYARWQVNGNMASMRTTIFGLTDQNSACISSGEVTKSIAELINLSDADAWKEITGEYTSKPSVSQMTQSKMNKRVTTITVPYRTWAKSGDKVIGTVGGYKVTKKEQKLTVNKAVAELFEAFFTDVYNEATNFVIRSWDGCYVYRTSRSSSNLSAHAFGVACDINADTPGNGFGEKPYKTWSSVEKNVSGKSKYEVVYTESKVMQIAHKYTITNGVDWNNPNDAMHFSFIGDKTREQSKKISGLS